MDLQDAQSWLVEVLNEVSIQFQRVPGSAIFLRYVKSSYQDDPVRSAVELFLFLFAVRYLLAPTYSTQKKSYVALSEEVCARSPDRCDDTLTVHGRRSMSWWMIGPLSPWLRPKLYLKKLRTKNGR